MEPEPAPKVPVAVRLRPMMLWSPNTKPFKPSASTVKLVPLPVMVNWPYGPAPCVAKFRLGTLRHTIRWVASPVAHESARALDGSPKPGKAATRESIRIFRAGRNPSTNLSPRVVKKFSCKAAPSRQCTHQASGYLSETCARWNNITEHNHFKHLIALVAGGRVRASQSSARKPYRRFK